MDALFANMCEMLGETISCSHTKDVNFNQCKQFLLHGFIIVTIYLTIDVQYAMARKERTYLLNKELAATTNSYQVNKNADVCIDNGATLE